MSIYSIELSRGREQLLLVSLRCASIHEAHAKTLQLKEAVLAQEPPTKLLHPRADILAVTRLLKDEDTQNG